MEMKVGHKIRKLRELKGISAKKMALALEMSPAGYSKIERDEVGVTMDRIEQAAVALSIRPEELITFDEGAIFSYSTLNSCSFNQSGAVYNQLPEKLVQLYEDKIKLLEEKVAMLERQLGARR